MKQRAGVEQRMERELIEIDQVILVRDDLKMSAGKIAAQCSHAGVYILRHQTTSNFACYSDGMIAVGLYKKLVKGRSSELKQWEANGEVTIVLRVANQADLRMP